MKFYNTLTKKKEEFIPLEEGKVKMYVCGPTVYNFIHIGNARPMIVFDMEAMNVRPATTHPLATQEIPGMIEMISTLVEKGYAYDVNGTVYFRTRKFDEYGKLSHKNLDDLRSGGRSLLVSGEDQKEDPLDFVLWKPKKEGEPFWVSPWGEGRPGWHIECSEMSKKYLGEEIDIHAGGEDLIFPHHENEIAQSECCNGKPFARYWLHNAFLNIDNRKMSKSLGNFFTVREIGEKYDLQVLRFFMLSAHYRSPLNFSADIMEASKNAYERIVTAVDRLKEFSSAAKTEALTEEETGKLKEMEQFRAKYEEAMDDDLNTSDALAAVFELVKFANTEVTEASSRAFAERVKDEIKELCGRRRERQGISPGRMRSVMSCWQKESCWKIPEKV